MNSDSYDFLSVIGIKRLLIIVGIILLAAMLATKLFVISLLVILSFVISFLIGKFQLRILGIELVTFLAVVGGYVYGPTTGIILGLVLITFHLVISGYFGVYYAWVIPEYAVAGYLAAQWSSQPIGMLGMTILILLIAVNIFLTLIFTKQEIGNYIPYTIMQILFNAFMFFVIGPSVVGILMS